jgi:hypothetical protein
MGFPAVVGGLLGLGSLGLAYYATRSMMKGQQNAGNSALLDLQNSNATMLDSLPELPQAPGDAAEGGGDSEAEKARKAQLAALAQAEQRNAANPTGGRGVLGLPNTARKSLLGY